jgi:hypothetical protein
MQLSGNTLVKHAVLPVPGNPKRAIELSGELLAVSDSNVRAFSLADLDVVVQTADVTIGTCVMPTIPGQTGGGINGWVGNDVGGNDNPSDPLPNGNPSNGSGMSWLLSGGCN